MPTRHVFFDAKQAKIIRLFYRRGIDFRLINPQVKFNIYSLNLANKHGISRRLAYINYLIAIVFFNKKHLIGRGFSKFNEFFSYIPPLSSLRVDGGSAPIRLLIAGL